MPLIKSASKKAVGTNIKREEAAGKPKKQAIAIALDVQRRAGGKVSPKPNKEHKMAKAKHHEHEEHHKKEHHKKDGKHHGGKMALKAKEAHKGKKK
jgi:hypothetical protein